MPTRSTGPLYDRRTVKPFRIMLRIIDVPFPAGPEINNCIPIAIWGYLMSLDAHPRFAEGSARVLALLDAELVQISEGIVEIIEIFARESGDETVLQYIQPIFDLIQHIRSTSPDTQEGRDVRTHLFRIVQDVLEAVRAR